MLIPEALTRSAERAPENIALYFRDRKILYSELADKVTKLSEALWSLELSTGSRVALCLQNSPEFISAYYATLCRGGVIVPINTFLVRAEIEYILHDSQAQILITNPLFWERFEPILSKTGCSVKKVLLVGMASGSQDISDGVRSNVEVLDFEQAICQADGARAPKAALGAPNDLAELIYTSGTTGRPKGVMLSHRNLTSNTLSVASALQTSEQDIYLALLPLFHITSQQACMLTPLSVGAGISVLEKIDRADLMYSLTHHRPTIFIAVPSLYNMLSQLPAPPPSQNPVRLYVSGGAPLSREIYHRFEQAYQKPIYQGYGLTEASPVVSWNLPDQNRPGSSGRALSGVQLKIVDDANRELPTGQTGEVCVKGKLVMMGYYNLPQSSRETIVKGWLKTGDMGYLDEEDYLFVVDRKKEMLLFRGMNVYPREIEEVLLQHPAILEAAVVGAEELAKGEIPIAFLTPQASAKVDVKELQEFCAAHLARYKVPPPVRPTGRDAENGVWKD